MNCCCSLLIPLFSLSLSICVYLAPVPSPRIEPKTLAQNSYQLLVGLYYWIRLVCGAQTAAESGYTGTQLLPTQFHPTQPVDQIWTGCVQCVLEAAASLPSGDCGSMLVGFTSHHLFIFAAVSIQLA